MSAQVFYVYSGVMYIQVCYVYSGVLCLLRCVMSIQVCYVYSFDKNKKTRAYTPIIMVLVQVATMTFLHLQYLICNHGEQIERAF